MICQGHDLAAFVNEPTGLARIREESNRLRCSDKDKNVNIREHLQCRVDGVGDAGWCHTAGTALHMRDLRFAEQAHIERCGNLPGDLQGISLCCQSPDKQCTPAASFADRFRCTADCLILGGGRLGAVDDGRCELPCLAPRRIARQNQGRDARRRQRGLDRRFRCRGNVVRPFDPPQPVGHRRSQALDVGCQRRIERKMVGGMVADDIDHRNAGAPGIVQVGEPVCQSRPRMKQRRGRAAGHPRVTIGSACHHALEKPQHATHVRPAIESRNKMHFRRARVGEADVDVIGQKHIAQNISTVHGQPAIRPFPRDRSRTMSA